MPTALISVSDKSGIIEFADTLFNMGWAILATGGTAKALRAGDVPVRDVAEVIGSPLLNDLVKTLSTELAAGLLYTERQRWELERNAVPFIELLCCDLYDLTKAVRNPEATEDSVREHTDIGGVTLLRAAAKGRRIVICEPKERMPVLRWIQQGQPGDKWIRRSMAAKAEFECAKYCLTSAAYLSNGDYDGFIGEKIRDCCYGENKWQSPAALFATNTDDPLAVWRFKDVEGNVPSFINWRDLDRSLRTTNAIAAVMERNRGDVPPIAVGVKHGNPCGAAFGSTGVEATRRMVSSDPISLFGGAVMTTFTVTGDVARTLQRTGVPDDAPDRILDFVSAPAFDSTAVELLKRTGGKCRLYSNPALETLCEATLDREPMTVPARGGFLRQPNFTYVFDERHEFLIKRGTRLPVSRRNDLLLACAVASTSDSNTITLAKDGHIIANAVGQQNRKRGCYLALAIAQECGHDPFGAVACGDSFFPFPDGPELLIAAGIGAVLATHGSVRDKEVIRVFAEAGRAFWTMPDELGRLFFGH